MLTEQNSSQDNLPGIPAAGKFSGTGSRNPKPFLKWAGGKTQLLTEIKDRLPDLVSSQKFTYVEPFIGSGAVLF
jgi:hypothetical protein